MLKEYLPMLRIFLHRPNITHPIFYLFRVPGAAGLITLPLLTTNKAEEKMLQMMQQRRFLFYLKIQNEPFYMNR